MALRRSAPPPRLSLTCVGTPKCSVYFEPWGTELTLVQDDVLYIESEAIATGHVEVSFVVDGIIVGFTSESPVAVTNRLGETLDI